MIEIYYKDNVIKGFIKDNELFKRGVVTVNHKVVADLYDHSYDELFDKVVCVSAQYYAGLRAREGADTSELFDDKDRKERLAL